MERRAPYGQPQPSYNGVAPQNTYPSPSPAPLYQTPAPTLTYATQNNYPAPAQPQYPQVLRDSSLYRNAFFFQPPPASNSYKGTEAFMQIDDPPSLWRVQAPYYGDPDEYSDYGTPSYNQQGPSYPAPAPSYPATQAPYGTFPLI